MYLKRKIDFILCNWYKDKKKKPLVIKGPRQVGKTRSIVEFGKKYYESMVYINFAEKQKYKRITKDSFTPSNIIDEIMIIDKSHSFIPNKTLIFFDEVQDHMDILSSLKFFSLENKYDIICSGSMLGVLYNQVSHVSVGYYNTIDMFGFDFEEFLWAKGYKEEQINKLFDCAINLKEVPSLMHDVISNDFFHYTLIGGYPSVILDYLENKFANTQAEQKLIIDNTKLDFIKYANDTNKFKLIEVFNAIPVFLGRENKTFTYSYFKQKGRYFDGLFDWLLESGIINLSRRSKRLEEPLVGFLDYKKYKLYLSDTGLLLSMLEDDKIDYLRVHRNYHIYKGGIYENLIANTLFKQGYDLVHFRNEKSTLEIDFVINSAFGLIPIEVKATSGHAKSLTEVVTNKENHPNVSFAIKVTDQNINVSNKIIQLPHYLMFKLKEILKSDVFKENIKKLI